MKKSKNENVKEVDNINFKETIKSGVTDLAKSMVTALMVGYSVIDVVKRIREIK